MVSSAIPDAPPLAWPALRRPFGSAKLIYLDQKHWIHLAQADTGHRDGPRYAAALQAARAALAAGTAIFPLSLTHYEETLKITDPRQRGDLARVMEQLSGFTALPARRLTALYELDAALAPAVRIEASALTPTDLLGRGFRWAHGLPIVGRIVGPDGKDGTELLRERLGRAAADQLVVDFELFTERTMLTGPAAGDLSKLQALGYDPAAVARFAQDRADNEAAFSAIVPDDVRRHPTNLLDRVLARELNEPDMVRAWKDLSDAYGLGVFDALAEDNPAAARALTRSMPGADVAAVLKTNRHRDATRAWTNNDMFDIDALTVAVPYCDIVGTDNAQAHALTVTSLASRMGTTVMRSVTELPGHL
jgi:hypothetical protein